jgi:hypothetical protein
MVVKMRSSEFKASSAKNKPVGSDLELPLPHEPLKEWWPVKISWLEAIRQSAPSREYYMQHFDSPEVRVRGKNTQLFRLP